MSDIEQTMKQELRREVLVMRRAVPGALITANSNVIAGKLTGWTNYLHANTLMIYLAMPDEPQTEIIIRDALQKGKKVCVPLLGENLGEMSAARIDDFDRLVTGRLGLKMPNPQNAVIVCPQTIDLIVVPGVAFDLSGGRLGMGAGYYDRFLPKAPNSTLLGLSWSFQLVEKVPREPHDFKMHYLLTEKGLVKC